MKALIDCVRDFVMQYPNLKEGVLGVDFLGDNATEYCVEVVPCTPVFRQYTDGDCLKQFLFIFASREWFSADVVQNTENLAFYEDFGQWIREQNLSGNLPDLDGREPFSIEVMTGGYAFDADSNTARYQMQLRLIYHEEE
ncbi:MAG: chloramphenicol resistance protein [Ruminococcus sp.]|nr:chloramphenicol resistance protein [Ruminococcus sp.]